MIVSSKNIYETCIMFLCSTPGKREVRMSLSETDSWVWRGSKMTCGMHGKMDSETIGEMFDETDSKRNEKDDLEPAMSMENHGS
jgi:hypothetical protein